MGKNMKKVITLVLISVLITAFLSGCGSTEKNNDTQQSTDTVSSTQAVSDVTENETVKETETQKALKTQETIKWDESWEFADFSIIHTDSVTKYYAQENRKDITVCVNAGHGTKGGSSKFTYCHPDKTPKVTGGSTQEGAVKATSVNEGTDLFAGVSEATANLRLAKILKNELLAEGYDVLMIREESDVQLDNIARTVLANNNADCHISIHYDATENDKGLFYVGVPNVKSYRKMYPVCDTWEKTEALGQAIIKAEKESGVKIFSDGNMPLDYTQTSYSKVPSVDVEVGDRASDISKKTHTQIAKGIVKGVDSYFQNR